MECDDNDDILRELIRVNVGAITRYTRYTRYINHTVLIYGSYLDCVMIAIIIIIIYILQQVWNTEYKGLINPAEPRSFNLI